MGAQKQKTKVNQTTQSAPWAAQQPFITDAFKGAQTNYQNSGPNADMMAAWNMARDNATNPNSGFGMSRKYYTDIMNSGGYDPNVFANISSPIMASINSQFMGSGRTGGGLQGIDLADTITKAYSPFAVNQMNMAAGALPQMDAQNTNALYNIGRQQYDLPNEALRNYYGIIGANNWGGTSNTRGTTTNTTSGNTLGQIAGAATGLLGSAIMGGFNPLSMLSGSSSIYNPTMVGTPYTVK